MLQYFRSLSALLACLVLAGCAAKKDDISSRSGWTILFDGTQTRELRGYKLDRFPEKGWAIENGSLKTVPKVGRVDLITTEKYKDFELEFEWKVPPSGNSGVFYGVLETDGPAYSTGPEMQILDDSKHRDGGNPLTSAGSLYALIAPNASKKLNPLGEFNKARVVSKNGHIEHWLNGTKVVEYDWNSPELRALIKNSKFNSMPRFMESLEGHIGFQHHGEEIWFRNIRIRRL